VVNQLFVRAADSSNSSGMWSSGSGMQSNSKPGCSFVVPVQQAEVNLRLLAGVSEWLCRVEAVHV
jgi:hypothetical protein